VIDVIVAGGGPVGLAAAVQARMAGMEVVVVEPRPGPVDKACGEGLMPSAVAELAALGVRPPGVAFVGIRYVSPTQSVAARFRHGPGLGVRRTALHTALYERAESLGVRHVVGRVEQVRQDDDGVTVGGLQSRWLLAADGLHSPVRRALGLERSAPGPVRFGLRRHFATAPWSEHVDVHWSPTAEAYVTPVAPDLVGVALLGPPGGHFDDLMSQFPRLVERVRGAQAVTSERGAGPLRQEVSSRVRGRVLLIGDAAGYVDALTGEGICTGLRTAAAAVEAVRQGRPESYERDWSRATRHYRYLTTALLWAASRPRLRSGLVPTAVRLPRVFGWAVNALA
jgi:flavin-dependent dehydrogenase